MATWEDGPEYAPYERPDDFQLPSIEPLAFAPPAEALPSSPPERPAFHEPRGAVAALATLVPTVEDPRDPQQPFDVVTDSLTTDSGWGAVRWSAPSGPPAEAPLVAGPPAAGPPVAGPPGAASPWPPPAEPGAFPAPGTPQWFGPGPYAPPPAPEQASFGKVFNAATPGLIICLVIGGVLYWLAPIMLVIGALLANRVTAGQSAVKRALGIAVTVMIAAAVYTGMDAYSFTEWWGTLGVLALVLCWVMIVVVLVLVNRGLKETGSAAPRRATWG